ncbi:hypothetical protein PENTCL1PPCAC_24394, partial [Pristionchus entomophagus]
MAFWPIVVLQTFLYCFTDKRKPDADKSEELDSGFLNRLTNWWFTTVQIRGAKNDLEMDDLFDLNPGSKSPHLGALFEKYWIPKLKVTLMRDGQHVSHFFSKMPVPPSMINALFRMFKYEFLTATAFKLMSDTLQFVNPFLLNQLISFVSSPDGAFWLGISYAVLMFVVSEIRSLMLNVYNNIMMRMGMKIQTALTTAVYRKTLRLSAPERRKKTVGEIINHMAIDVEIFQNLTPQVQMFWSCPYQIVLALTYLIILLGYSALPGVAIMVAALPINIFGSLTVKK